MLYFVHIFTMLVSETDDIQKYKFCSKYKNSELFKKLNKKFHKKYTPNIGNNVEFGTFPGTHSQKSGIEFKEHNHWCQRMSPVALHCHPYIFIAFAITFIPPKYFLFFLLSSRESVD